MRLTYAYSVFVVALLGMAAIAVMDSEVDSTVYIGLALAALGVFLVAQPIALSDTTKGDDMIEAERRIESIKGQMDGIILYLTRAKPKPQKAELSRCGYCKEKIHNKIEVSFLNEDLDFCDHLCAIDYFEQEKNHASVAFIGRLITG